MDNKIATLNQTDQYQNMNLMMKINQRKGVIEQMMAHLNEIEDRLDDLDNRVSEKINQFGSAIHS